MKKNQSKIKNQLRKRRAIRVRAKVFGTAVRPRLAVFRSSKHLAVQAINDAKGQTLASVYDAEVKGKDKMAKASAMGKLLAEKLAAKKVKAAVFDKRHYKYHGLIKELAEGAREGGLKF